MPTHNINIRQMPLHKRGGPVIALSLRRPDEYTHAIVEEGRRRGWTLADLRLCGGRPPPGLVCQGAIVSDMPDSGLVAALRQTGCTVVRLGRLPHPQDASLPAVLSDFAAAGRLAAEHFSERQFSHVGYVGFQPWSDAKGLYDAFHAQAIALGMESHLLRFKSKPGKSEQGKPVGGSRPSDAELFDQRQQQFRDWLESVPKPMGVLGFSDEMAGKICFRCEQAGFNVPTEVAVLGRGNQVTKCESVMPTLSSIDLDHDGHARSTCDLLSRLMAGEVAPAEPVVIPPRGVVVRESTDVLATRNADVAAALRYIWEHLERDLSVDIIAQEVGVSRRKLERGFRQELRRSINAEIRRKRLEQICMLLTSTDQSIADLAPLVGFRSKDYLHRTFMRAFGITPRQFRLQHRGQG